MPHGDKVILERSRQVGEELHEIAEGQVRLGTISRPIVREALAVSLLKQIESFRYRIAGFRQPLAREFSVAAVAWEKLAQRQVIESRNLVARKSIAQVFRAGDPVNREGEAFVYRDSVVGTLDQQVTLSGGCPGIVLYARRRMGKTTLLTNLEGFLPKEVGIRYISMQDVAVSTSLQHFIKKITGETASDLPGLARYLDNLNDGLGAESKRLLLALDEYENIDNRIGEGVFSLSLLAAIRGIDAEAPPDCLALCRQPSDRGAPPRTVDLVPDLGAHPHYPLSSLSTRRACSSQTRCETPRSSRPNEDRPRYLPALWGDSGIERIHTEAGGWPHLVQLIAETVVQRLNELNLREVTGDLLEILPRPSGHKRPDRIA